MIESESLNPASRSNCFCVSIAPMRTSSKSRFDIAGVAAIFLLPRRSERTPAGQAATVCGILLPVPVGVPPAQPTGIRAEALRLAMGLNLHFFAAAQAERFCRTGSCCLPNWRNPASLTKRFYRIYRQAQCSRNFSTAFSHLPVTNDIILFSDRHKKLLSRKRPDCSGPAFFIRTIYLPNSAFLNNPCIFAGHPPHTRADNNCMPAVLRSRYQREGAARRNGRKPCVFRPVAAADIYFSAF